VEAPPAVISVRRLIASLAIALPLVFAASAHAYVYWGEPQAGAIGRANDDGTAVQNGFIETGGRPIGVAVNSSYIYWANETLGTIGRANLDGTGVEPNFITGIKEPHGLAVNSSSIFWASFGGHEIGRANLDGTGKNLGLVTAAGSPCSIAIDSGHIYWGNAGLESSIARASLPGNSKELEWVPLGAYVPCAVAANSANVFFGNNGFLGHPLHEIGRVGINGTGLDKSIIGEAEGPCGLTVYGSQLYWANEGDGTIGVANTDATGVDESLVTTGGGQICGVAVDALSSPFVPPVTPPAGPSTPGSGSGSGGSPSPPASSPPPGTLRFVQLKLDGKQGTARLAVATNEAGTVKLSGKGVVSASVQARGAETVTLAVRATKAKGAILKRIGHLKATLTITFNPRGGASAASLNRSLSLHELVRQRG
jgi:hypothetical protein